MKKNLFKIFIILISLVIIIPIIIGKTQANSKIEPISSIKINAVTPMSSSVTFLPLVARQATSPPIMPNDVYFSDGSQWGLHNIGQSGGTVNADINAPEAWAMTTGSSSVIVAVIDTGVDIHHPEFAGKLTSGWNYVNNSSNPDDDNGHGTHVAGIIGAKSNNSIGVAGVAWGTRIMPIKALDTNGSGWTSDIAQGIYFAANNGAKVINLSLGSISSSYTLQTAINYAYSLGILIVASAGNCGDPSSYWLNGCSTLNQPSYPAAGANTLAVASTTRKDLRSSFSTQGSYVDVAAPGSSIRSTIPLDISSNIGITGYDNYSGTSMAAPMVSGLAALIYSLYPSYSNQQVAQAIVNNADDLGTIGKDISFGCGRINAYRSLINGASGIGCGGWTSFSEKTDFLIQTQEYNKLAIRPGVLLVSFKDKSDMINMQLKNTEAQIVRQVSNETFMINVPEGAELYYLEKFRNDPAVKFAEPDIRHYINR